MQDTSIVSIRLRKEELDNLDKVSEELKRMYPTLETFSRSEVIRWCIRSASGRLLS